MDGLPTGWGFQKVPINSLKMSGHVKGEEILVMSYVVVVTTSNFISPVKVPTCLKLLLVSEGHFLGDLFFGRQFVSLVLGLVEVLVVVVLLGDGLLTGKRRLARGPELLLEGVEPGLKEN